MSRFFSRTTLRSALFFSLGYLLLATLLQLANQPNTSSNRLIEDSRMAELRQTLSRDPNNEVLKEEARERDRILRQRFHLSRDFAAKTGFLMLLAGGIAIYCVWRLRRDSLPPEPSAPTPSWVVPDAASRIALNLTAFALSAGTVFLYFQASPEPLPEITEASPQPKVSQTEKVEGPQWNRFRGPEGSGVSPFAAPPYTTEKGQLLWTADIPLPGPNSPVIWGSKVFLSGADGRTRAIYCLDLKTGKQLWENRIGAGERKEPEVFEDTGHAAPTLAVNDTGVFGLFSNGGLAGYSLDGKLLWQKNLGIPENVYGIASSPILDDEKLYIQFDQGYIEDEKSRMIAIDLKSGNEIWSVKRKVDASWTTPILVNTGNRRELFTVSTPDVIAHDPQDGSLLWKLKCMRGEVASSPVYYNETYYVVHMDASLFAIEPAAENWLWEGIEALPDITSPLAVEDRVIVADTYGKLACYDAKDGKVLWKHEVDMTIKASPSYSGGQLLLLSEAGELVAAEFRDGWRELSKIKFEGKLFHASPSFAKGILLLRSSKKLFCWGAKP